MNFINLTAHEIVVYKTEDVNVTPIGYVANENAIPILTIKPSGDIVRVATKVNSLPNVECYGVSIPVDRVKYEHPQNLPEPHEGIGLIVSSITANAARDTGRTVDDLFIPNGIVRNNSGIVIGCLGFYQV